MKPFFFFRCRFFCPPSKKCPFGQGWPEFFFFVFFFFFLAMRRIFTFFFCQQQAAPTANGVFFFFSPMQIQKEN